ncbi:MAG: DNA replication complex GINS family protein [Candidatus Aenigmarchaeota archaeon]|nr:DNA replication complex GINS family protein [Candidatus Aenigmarchaeota archaeon]
MLTDETIRRIFEEEKNSQGLTKLPDDFFGQVREYFEKKTKMVRIEADQWALDSIKRRLKTIFGGRERKILNSAPGFIDSGVLLENMTPEEGKFFERVVECIKGFQKEREEKLEEEEENLVLVTILEDVQKFVGINMKNYGSFKRGDITTLPEPNADLLIKKGLVEKTEMR